MFGEESLIPFYYCVIGLFFVVVFGFLTRCYCDNDNKIFQQSKVLVPEGEHVEIVCTRSDGHVLLKDMLTKIFIDAGINAHSFRHTNATTLIENGATPKGVAGRLGHSNTLITQNLYTHNTEKLQNDTAEIFSKTLQTKT